MLLASCDVCSPHYYESLPLWMELKFSFFTSCFNFLVIVSHVLLDVYLLFVYSLIVFNCIQLPVTTSPISLMCVNVHLFVSLHATCLLLQSICQLSMDFSGFLLQPFSDNYVFSFFVYIKRCTNVLSVSKLLQNYTCETGFFHDRIILCARFLFLFYYSML